MKKSEIIKKLEQEFKSIDQLLHQLSEKQIFSEQLNQKWSIAENIEHLILATKPLVWLFSNPEIMSSNWGHSDRASRQYNDVVDLYLENIGTPGETTDTFTPANMKYTKLSMIQKFQHIYSSLQKNVSVLSEQDLDQYQIPHPKIGLLTCKEFLFFTHYHTAHHLNTIKQLLENETSTT